MARRSRAKPVSKSFKCRFCDKRIKNDPKTVERHVQTGTHRRQQGLDVLPLHHCSACGKGIGRGDSWTRHMGNCKATPRPSHITLLKGPAIPQEILKRWVEEAREEADPPLVASPVAGPSHYPGMLTSRQARSSSSASASSHSATPALTSADTSATSEDGMEAEFAFQASGVEEVAEREEVPVEDVAWSVEDVYQFGGWDGEGVEAAVDDKVVPEVAWNDRDYWDADTDRIIVEEPYEVRRERVTTWLQDPESLGLTDDGDSNMTWTFRPLATATDLDASDEADSQYYQWLPSLL